MKQEGKQEVVRAMRIIILDREAWEEFTKKEAFELQSEEVKGVTHNNI